NRHYDRSTRRRLDAPDACARARLRLERMLAWVLLLCQSVALRSVLAIEHLNRLARHDGGDRVFVNELRMPVAAEQYAEIIERRDYARQLDAVDKEDCKWILGLSDRIQKQILKILRAFRHFSYLSLAPPVPKQLVNSKAPVNHTCSHHESIMRNRKNVYAVSGQAFLCNVKKCLAQRKNHGTGTAVRYRHVIDRNYRHSDRRGGTDKGLARALGFLDRKATL